MSSASRPRPPSWGSASGRARARGPSRHSCRPRQSRDSQCTPVYIPRFFQNIGHTVWRWLTLPCTGCGHSWAPLPSTASKVQHRMSCNILFYLRFPERGPGARGQLALGARRCSGSGSGHMWWTLSSPPPGRRQVFSQFWHVIFANLWWVKIQHIDRKVKLVHLI